VRQFQFNSRPRFERVESTFRRFGFKVFELDHLHTLVYELLKQEVNQIPGAKSWIVKLSLHVIIVEEVIHISTLGIDVLLAKDADILMKCNWKHKLF
jgi:hypothetical protein